MASFFNSGAGIRRAARRYRRARPRVRHLAEMGTGRAGTEEAQDADDGNWLRVTGHCSAHGASIWVQGAILTVTDIDRFGRECQDLYDGKLDRASVEPYQPELRIVLEATDRQGHLRADVEITPDHLAQTHHLQFDAEA